MNQTQLSELLHRTADEIPVGQPPSLDSFRNPRPAAGARGHGWIGHWPVLAAAASVAAVIVVVFVLLPGGSTTVDSLDSNPTPRPANPDAQMRPDLMSPDPGTAYPSEYVDLRFPEGTFRGLAFVLEARVGDSWDFRYNLHSDRSGSDAEPFWAASGDPFGVEDIGIAGVGPDVVQIPDTATPGEYRICTANGSDDFCAPIQVTALPDLQAFRLTSFDCANDQPYSSETPTTVTDIKILLVCPADGGAPILISADNEVFASLAAALALPDLPSPPGISCATNYPPTVLARTSDATYELHVPTHICGLEREEVADALDGDPAGPHRSAPLDPLTMSLDFGQESADGLTVQSGSELNTDWLVENNSGATITDPGCKIASARYGLIPIDQPDAELPWGAAVDCAGPLQMSDSYTERFTGPDFGAITLTGEPLPPGQYLAAVEIEGRSQRMAYPVTVTP